MPSLATIPKPVLGIPCDCPPGKGLNGNITSSTKCESCTAGEYSAGGELINDWYRWTVNGTLPPEDSNILAYCDSYRNYVKGCDHWKATGKVLISLVESLFLFLFQHGLSYNVIQLCLM